MTTKTIENYISGGFNIVGPGTTSAMESVKELRRSLKHHIVSAESSVHERLVADT